MTTDFADTATAVEEVAVGAAETAAEVAANPVGAVRKQMKSFERRGQPAVRRPVFEEAALDAVAGLRETLSRRSHGRRTAHADRQRQEEHQE